MLQGAVMIEYWFAVSFISDAAKEMLKNSGCDAYYVSSHPNVHIVCIKHNGDLERSISTDYFNTDILHSQLTGLHLILRTISLEIEPSKASIIETELVTLEEAAEGK